MLILYFKQSISHIDKYKYNHLLSFSGNLVSTGYRVLQYKYINEILQDTDKHTHMINIHYE